jgi:hypothetical protein
MREICQSGSEGGGTELNRSSLPLSGRFCCKPKLSQDLAITRFKQSKTLIHGGAMLGGCVMFGSG